MTTETACPCGIDHTEHVEEPEHWADEGASVHLCGSPCDGCEDVTGIAGADDAPACKACVAVMVAEAVA